MPFSLQQFITNITDFQIISSNMSLFYVNPPKASHLTQSKNSSPCTGLHNRVLVMSRQLHWLLHYAPLLTLHE